MKELELIVQYRQRLATIKSVVTRKANAEKVAKAKALMASEKALEKAARTPEEINDKKVLRAERRAEKLLKETLLAAL